jgi:hypothetical protein
MGWWASTAGAALLPRHMHRARFMRGILIMTAVMDVMVRSGNAQGEWVKRRDLASFILPTIVAALSAAATVWYQHLCRQLCLWPQSADPRQDTFVSVRPLESGASTSCCHSSRRVDSVCRVWHGSEWATMRVLQPQVCRRQCYSQAQTLTPRASPPSLGISCRSALTATKHARVHVSISNLIQPTVASELKWVRMHTDHLCGTRHTEPSSVIDKDRRERGKAYSSASK